MAVQRRVVWLPIVLLLVPVGGTVGCATGSALQRRSNALEFLYPNGKEAELPRDVVLQVPLRVGLAFAPAEYVSGDQSMVLSGEQKQKLMTHVANAFASNRSVRRIEALPAHYLEPRGGFSSVDRLSRAFDLDIIALISYDQFMTSDTDRLGSLAYWTLVGVHLVKAEKNQTRTLMDVVVYDIRSRTLLFRAAGESVVNGRASPVGLAAERRAQSDVGFRQATDGLITNLKTSFDEFAKQAASGTVRGPGTPAVRIARTPEAQVASHGGGSGGAGALGFVDLLIAAMLGAAALRVRS
jgi:rhombotail lipoprotein